MTYSEAIDYLYNVTPVFEHVGASAYKPGLQTTEALDLHYGHPHLAYKTIHVAGTNGKGSCSHSIASILQEAGYKVGLYTSPHLVDFCERIRVNGEPVSKQFVVDFIEDFIRWNNGAEADSAGISPKEPLAPSFFELTTAMAFKYFADQQVDIAVIEVGLGGRLDCTNIINPVLSIITNISFDHTQLLGNSLEEIAAEKAGIIKNEVPVVVGETVSETRPVFLHKALVMNSPIHFAEEFQPPYPLPDFELKGKYQERNLRTILCAADQLCEMGILPPNAETGGWSHALLHVTENTGLMGRWQTLQTSPLVICDTGHNVGGWQYLAPQIKAQPCKQLRMVFGMVDDKDIDAILAMLPKDAVYYFTQADNHRAIPASIVAQKAMACGLQGHPFQTVSVAYHKALADADIDDFIFIGGSSYVVADLLSSIR